MHTYIYICIHVCICMCIYTAVQRYMWSRKLQSRQGMCERHAHMRALQIRVFSGQVRDPILAFACADFLPKTFVYMRITTVTVTVTQLCADFLRTLVQMCVIIVTDVCDRDRDRRP